MNNPNLKKKFQCYYEKLLLSKTVQLVTFIDNIGVRAGGAREAAAPPNFGQLRFFGQQRKFGQSQLLKTFSCFFY